MIRGSCGWPATSVPVFREIAPEDGGAPPHTTQSLQPQPDEPGTILDPGQFEWAGVERRRAPSLRVGAPVSAAAGSIGTHTAFQRSGAGARRVHTARKRWNLPRELTQRLQAPASDAAITEWTPWKPPAEGGGHRPAETGAASRPSRLAIAPVEPRATFVSATVVSEPKALLGQVAEQHQLPWGCIVERPTSLPPS